MASKLLGVNKEPSGSWLMSNSARSSDPQARSCTNRIARCHQGIMLCLLTWPLLHEASILQGSYQFPLRHPQAFTGSLSSPCVFSSGLDTGMESVLESIRGLCSLSLVLKKSEPSSSQAMLAHEEIGISAWLLYSRCKATIF